MILTSLELRNFKKFTSFKVDFKEGLIGIVGKNGSGKSTIFEAILFALYGELKNRGNKELVKNINATTKESVSITLQFELNNTKYIVIREFRGKTLTINAKLYENETLITSGAKEVTKTIAQLTQTSKDAFIHTLFASQKELTSLSALKNEDRKKIIRKLLGLQKIDFIEKELIEKSRELKREIRTYDEILLSKDDINLKNEQIEQNNTQKLALMKEQSDATKVLNSLKIEEQALKKILKVFNETKELQQKTLSKIELIKSSIKAQNTTKSKLQDETKELSLKKVELQNLAHVKTDYIAIQESLKTQQQLKEFFLQKEGLDKEQKSLGEQYKKSKSEIQTLEQECINKISLIEDTNLKNKEINTLQKIIEKYNDDEKELIKQISAQQSLIDDTNTKIKNIQNLGQGSACPTCTRPLLDEYDNVIDSLSDIIVNLYQKTIDKLNKELSTTVTEKNKQNNLLTSLQSIYQKQATQINIIQTKEIDLNKAKVYFQSIEKQGLQNADELQSLKQYNYDETQHKSILKHYEDLKPQYEKVLQLETKLQRVDTIDKELKSVEEKLLELNTALQKKEQELTLIDYDEKKHLSSQKEYEVLENSKEVTSTNLNAINLKIAKIDGEIKTIQSTLDTNQKQLSKLQTKIDDQRDYEKIKTSLSAFKTKLNTKISPRISSIASTMYAKITKGKYQYIEVDNDFNFFIYDDGKKYPIERFSGGEVDLANLVLRIAISKTLVELNGNANISFLAFDEVFGSQDEARRLEILEAFHTIKEQYRQIFLISHESEIKEMFETLIEL